MVIRAHFPTGPPVLVAQKLFFFLPPWPFVCSRYNGCDPLCGISVFPMRYPPLLVFVLSACQRLGGDRHV